jgi:hypothetical protein
MLSSKAGTRLLQGTIFAAAMMLAPGALAHSSYYGYSHPYGDRSDSGYSHAYDDRGDNGYGHRRYSHHRHHHHFAGSHRHYAMSSRHRSHRKFATTGRERMIAGEDERSERHRDRQHFAHAGYGVVDERRERMIADEREEAMTARLNLAELRKGQERDAAIARWEEEYGGLLRG